MKRQHWSFRPGLWLFHQGHPHLARYVLKPAIWLAMLRLDRGAR